MTNSPDRSSAANEDEWLIIKRGLFFRPDCCGYTGIRDEAGRYDHEFAKTYEGDSEITIMRFAGAPEFLPAAYSDLVIKHLTKQRDEARAALTSDAAQASWQRFQITWDRGAYYVSIPNFQGGEVVGAAEYDRLAALYDAEDKKAADEIASLRLELEASATQAANYRAQIEDAKCYVERAIASYEGDPAGNQFQKGFLAALEIVRDEALASQLPAAPIEAPGHEDLMVSPESIDAFMAANPLPEPADSVETGHTALDGRSYDAGLEAAASICEQTVSTSAGIEPRVPGHARVIRLLKGTVPGVPRSSAESSAVADDLVARLDQRLRSDHKRGCQGRQYTCSCQFDDDTEKLLEESLNVIGAQSMRLEACDVEIAKLRSAVPQTALVPTSADEIAVLLRDEFGNLSSFDARSIARVITDRYSLTRPQRGVGE